MDIYKLQEWEESTRKMEMLTASGRQRMALTVSSVQCETT